MDDNWITVTTLKLEYIYLHLILHFRVQRNYVFRDMLTSAHGPMDSSSISEWSDHGIAECERACPSPVYATTHAIVTEFSTQFSRLVCFDRLDRRCWLLSMQRLGTFTRRHWSTVHDVSTYRSPRMSATSLRLFSELGRMKWRCCNLD